MTETLIFNVADALTGRKVGRLDPDTFSFNDPIMWGGAGQGNFTLPIPGKKGPVESLRRRTTPWQNVIHAEVGGEIIWSGMINYRARTPGKNILTVQCEQIKAIMYRRIMFSYKYGLGTFWWATGTPGTNKTAEGYAVLATDEYQHVANFMNRYNNDLNNGQQGIIPIVYDPTALSGDLRDLTVPAGTTFGDSLDRIGKRDGGFEWSIGTRKNAITGYYEFFMELWEPGAVRTSGALLFLDQKQSVNKVAFGEWPEDATAYASRVIATGDSSGSDVPYAWDYDPNIDLDSVVLTEALQNWPGDTVQATLFDHARAMRLALTDYTTLVPVDVSIEHPPLHEYRSGDRARVRIKDDWDDVDIPAARIVDRAVTKAQNSGTVATLSIDVADYEMPEDDS